MIFRRDSFWRCYLEAWVFWIGLNIVGELVFGLLDPPGFPPPFYHLALLVEPGVLIAQGLMIVPVAGILVGSRRPTA
jgi:hypothetical protein